MPLTEDPPTPRAALANRGVDQSASRFIPDIQLLTQHEADTAVLAAMRVNSPIQLLTSSISSGDQQLSSNVRDLGGRLTAPPRLPSILLAVSQRACRPAVSGSAGCCWWTRSPAQFAARSNLSPRPPKRARAKSDAMLKAALYGVQKSRRDEPWCRSRRHPPSRPHAVLRCCQWWSARLQKIVERPHA